ncbi:MAG: diacylglycerol kinase family lipid kinase [Chitinophagaceae bacterium]|nr:diacylglycerol kinase family lipid kinase [Chitinophagaceae bacterium]
MQNQGSLKLLFIINPVSGGKEKTNWEAQIREYFKDSPHNMDFYLLTGKSDKASIEHYIKKITPDRVVGVGGDGTVKMIAELLNGTQTPLAIIPAGSANGMAKELSIPINVNQALDIAVNGICKSIDIIKINDEEICIHLSDIGLNAMLVKYFQKSQKRGMWGYGKTIFRVLWEKQKMYATIKTDTDIIKRKAYMIVVANARKYGTGATINPRGDVADGLLEIVVVRKLNVLELLKMLITHQPFHANRIEVFQSKKLELSLLKKSYFQVDGEYRGKTREINAMIIMHQLRVMVPTLDANVA